MVGELAITFFKWLFSFNFTKNTAAAVVGTGITAAPLFGVLDMRITSEIEEVREMIDQRATIYYVDNQDRVAAMTVNELAKRLDELRDGQNVTNSRLWELVQDKRSK